MKSHKTGHTKNPQNVNWCPGCGDLAIWTAFKETSHENGWDNTNTLLVAGIGCHGHMVNFVKTTAFEGLHGRALPVASGAKMANHKLNVFVITGDGDCLAEGGNHFIHACRRNHDLTVILHDNAIYGLTTGQTSPRSPLGYKSRSTPFGNIEEPLHPLRVALACGATFLARVYSGDIEMMKSILKQANEHKGFAVIQTLQPCVTFNKEYTHYFYQDNIYHLENDYDFTNKQAAFEKTLEWDVKKIPVGIIYKVDAPTYEGQIRQLNEKSLVEHDLENRDLQALFEKFS